MTQGSFPSLLDEIGVPPAPARGPLAARLRGRFRSRWAALRADPARWARFKRWSIACGSAAALGLGVGLYFWLRPVPQPDYLNDGMDDVLNYTLLTDEFNRLPVYERLKLIGELIARFRSMSSTDSVLMASFAAGIAGAARDQIVENGSRLAVDVWDKYAADYSGVPESQRDEYLDKTFIEFTKMMESLAGEARDISDEERLAEGRRQAQRDLEVMRSGDRGPRNEDLGRMFTFMNRDVGQHASGAQRARGQQMMRDMSRRLRGWDVATGKPSGGG